MADCSRTAQKTPGTARPRNENSLNDENPKIKRVKFENNGRDFDKPLANEKTESRRTAASSRLSSRSQKNRNTKSAK